MAMVTMLDSFSEGLLHTLATLTQEKAEARSEVPGAASSGLIGLCGLRSNEYCGVIAVDFPPAAYRKILEKWLGEDVTEIRPEHEDGVAELLNMIFGFAKVKLNELNYGLRMAIPTVIRGEDLNINDGAGALQLLAKSFTWAGETLTLRLWAKEEKIENAEQAAADYIKKIEAKNLMPFVDGVKRVFTTLVSATVFPGKPYVKSSKPPQPFDIASSIGVTGQHLSGSFTLCFQAANLLAFVNQMLGEKNESIQGLEDSASELVNMIFGHAKVVLNEQGHNVQMSIPTLLKGRRISTNYFTKDPVIVLPFESDMGGFQVEFAFQTEK